MSREDHSNRRAFWLVTALFLLVAGGLLSLIFASSSPSVFHSPPDQARPWAESSFQQSFDPSFTTPLSTLLTSPQPSTQFNVLSESSFTPQKLVVTHATPDVPSRNTFYEIFPAGSGGSATLPDGNKLTLTAIALMMPSDVEWGADRYPQKVPDWVDPRTGQPLPRADWQKKQGVPHEGPRLFLRIEKEGDAPLRWRWPQAFDAQTYQQISSSSSHSSQVKHGMFSVDLEIWHQTPLKLGVHFAFGEPRNQTLPLKEGASVSFGDDAVINLLEILPLGHNSSSWGGDSNEQRVTFSLLDTPGKYPERSFVFQVWPPQNHYLIEYSTDLEKRGRMLSGNRGIGAIELHREESKLTELQLRRFPKLGRAVFDLPVMPRLPHVTNLFDAPIPRTEIRHKSALFRAATEAAEVRTSISNYSDSIPDHLFPMVLIDTTPGKILREYEQLSGKRFFFSDEALQISDKKPPGPFEKLKDWWKRSKPGWLP